MTDSIIHLSPDEIQSKKELQGAIALAIELGQAADEYVKGNAFEEYQKQTTESTQEAQRRDLRRFEDFLNELYAASKQVSLRLRPGQLYDVPEAWIIVSFGLVKLFQESLLKSSYALSTINRTISTVRRYAELAHIAGHLELEAMLKIRNIKGYHGRSGRNLDKGRSKSGTKTRRGKKKEAPTPITQDQLIKLRDLDLYPDTPAGRLNRLVVLLCLDLGLRASEIAELKTSDLNADKTKLRFYRRKTDSIDSLNLTTELTQAVENYLKEDIPSLPPESDLPDLLLRATSKKGKFARTSINARHSQPALDTVWQKSWDSKSICS